MSNSEQLVGHILDKRYQIVKAIGSGGMSMVYEAVDLMDNRAVAIKVLKEEMAADLQAVKRFINESKAVSLLNHPGIVRIYNVGMSKQLKYIVMERVQGITLKSYIEKKGPLSLEEILSYSEQILRALSHAHSKGIIHRDIKPQNILLLRNGRIKVADFGIAKLPGGETATMTDKAIGTVYYISPEQASGQPIDPRSDLYSLGVCMYEMATGTLPFLADSPVSVALMQVNDTPRPPREILPSLPFGLEQIILGAMEKDPNRRFQDATQMLRHIAQLRSDPAFVFHTRRVRRSETERALMAASGNALASSRAPSPVRRILDPKAAKKKPMKKKKKQSSSMFPVIMGVAMAFLMVCIVCGYILLGAFFDMQASLQPTTVIVPDLIGEIYSAPLLNQYSDELYAFQLKYVQSDEYAEYTILEQDPTAGSSRKVRGEGSRCLITLTLACAEDSVMLPDLTITEHRIAAQQIEDMGLKVEQVREYNPNIEIGEIIRTDPAPGTPMKFGDTVTLYISRGPEIKTVVIPDFTANTPTEAYAKMLDPEGMQALVVGTISYGYSDTVPAGTIMGQSKSPYSAVVYGTRIDFVISLGPEIRYTTVPSFIGLLPEEARARMLDESGTELLTLGTVTFAYSESIPAGQIMDQSLAEGSEVVEGTSIDFVLSLGPDPSLSTTGPADTTEPGLPSDTTDPGNTTEPSDTAEPGDPAEPVDPDVPIDTSAPTQPEPPADTTFNGSDYLT